MKSAIRILLVIALLLTVFVSTVSAQGPSGTYASGITCVNLENTGGTFQIEFFNTTGASVGQINDSIAANGVKLYYTPNVTQLPDGFLGSAVVSASVQLACSVNTQTSTGTSRVGTSNGVSSADTATKLYVTQIMNNLGGFSSYVAVQNASDSAANVTAAYFNSTGAQAFTVTKNIPANSTHVFYQDGDEDGNGSADLPAGFIGSASFTSSAPLAGTVAMYNTGVSAGTAQFLSYNAFTSGAQKIFAPRVVKNLSGVGFTSGVTCQNVGSANTNISAAFTMFAQVTGQTHTATMTKTGVAPGQAWAFYLGNTGNTTLDGISRGYGNAVITSTASNIACTVNEDNRTNYAGQGSTYSGVPDGLQSNVASFQQVVALGAASYRGGFQFANTTASAGTCSYQFSNGDVVNNVPLPANGSISVFAENVLTNNKSNFNGSAIVTCNQPIVGIYNLAALSLPGDSFATNNGINR